MSDETRSDAEVRADDRARVGDDAVEYGGVTGGSGVTITDRRARPDASAPRAETRGIYRDTNGARRIVGQGDTIPDGWERVESAVVEDRVGTVPTNQSDPQATTAGGGEEGAGEAPPARSRSRRSSSSSS